MHEVSVHRVSAFTYDSLGGNEAGVVLLTAWLSDEAMQHVASEVGYSETAFLVVKDSTLHVRYFTPLKEVALCGHASLALLSVARKEGVIESGRHTLHARHALLEADVNPKAISLYFKPPKTEKTFNNPAFLETLELKPSMLNTTPIAIMNAGVRELFIGLKSVNALRTYQFDRATLKTLSETLNIEGVYLYTLDLDTRIVHARNFLPVLGINEESATGTATASLAAHLYNTLPNPPETLTFNQGEWMGKHSRLYATVHTQSNRLKGLYVSGIATIMDTIQVSLNNS